MLSYIRSLYIISVHICTTAHMPVCLSQCAAMNLELTVSTQQMVQLQAQVSRLESELAAGELSSGDTSSSTAQATELVALRHDVHNKERELSELRLQLHSALHSSTEVHLNG